jgi:hypothetical protein
MWIRTKLAHFDAKPARLRLVRLFQLTEQRFDPVVIGFQLGNCICHGVLRRELC